MRNNLVVTIALASFAVVTALGVGMAGADPAGAACIGAPLGGISDPVGAMLLPDSRLASSRFSWSATLSFI